MKLALSVLRCWAAASLLTGLAAHADITVGVVLPLTGPASGLGIPDRNGLSLWPTSIAGEKLKIILLDDATDPSQGAKHMRRLTAEDKADLVVGSAATPVAAGMALIAAESETLQFAMSPVPPIPGKDGWTLRMSNETSQMVGAIVAHLKKSGITSLGFLGYSDSYGQVWLDTLTTELKAAGIRMDVVERFGRADASITPQALKLKAAAPQAVLIVASGSGAAMPHRSLVELGYKGVIYQTHGAASRDLVRLGGKDVEGAFVVSSPAIAAEQLPANHPAKALATRFVNDYEKIHGAGSRNQFAAHMWDLALLLEQAVPIALKSGRPGTPEFRVALKNTIEHLAPVPTSGGLLQFTASNHWGFSDRSGVVMLKIANGDWKVEMP
jgi:branched-chain amino acid transport system substrate-binding protein